MVFVKISAQTGMAATLGPNLTVLLLRENLMFTCLTLRTEEPDLHVSGPVGTPNHLRAAVRATVLDVCARFPFHRHLLLC